VPRARKNGASGHLFPYSVPIRGVASTVIAIVTGIKKRFVYFTDDANTVLRILFSLLGSSFEKAGNKTVPIGTVTKLVRTAKLVAIL
jgi:hypothetical protein